MAAYTTEKITPKYHQALVGWQKKNFPELAYLETHWSEFFGNQTPFQLVAKIGRLNSETIDNGRFSGKPRLEH
ncbi:MAG TPA: hypothetical protein VGE86_00540, partial [Thermoanaerobaculia bacterium]